MKKKSLIKKSKNCWDCKTKKTKKRRSKRRSDGVRNDNNVFAYHNDRFIPKNINTSNFKKTSSPKNKKSPKKSNKTFNIYSLGSDDIKKLRKNRMY